MESLTILRLDQGLSNLIEVAYNLKGQGILGREDLAHN